MRIETSLTRMVGERQLGLMRLSSTNIANKMTRYPLPKHSHAITQDSVAVATPSAISGAMRNRIPVTILISTLWLMTPPPQSYVVIAATVLSRENQKWRVPIRSWLTLSAIASI